VYWQKRWDFLNSIEYEFTYKGNYGAKGEKRAARCKRTPEQIVRQNEINRKNKVRRLIKANFSPGDYWITLKYPQGIRKPLEEVKSDMRRFLSSMRAAYRREEDELKYIYRVEVGKRGGIHIHIILNRVRGKPPTDMLVNRYWKYGRANFTLLYEDGGYDQLASYLTKSPEEDEDAKAARAYVPSRNMIHPQPAKKEYFTRTVKKLVKEGPKPKEGFYIEKDSVISGVNPFTGLSYLHYTEVRINPIERMGGG
jgi:hypothetical protein